MENKIKMYFALLLIIFCFQLISCTYTNSHKNRINNVSNGLTYITLIENSQSHKINESGHLDSIVLKYSNIDSNIQRVRKFYFLKNSNTIYVSCNLLRKDSTVFIGSDSINAKEYKIFQTYKDSKTHHFSFLTQKYIEGGLRFIRRESILINGKKNSLNVFYGNDFGPKFSDSLYLFFDENTHIRLIKSKDGKLIFRDKNW